MGIRGLIRAYKKRAQACGDKDTKWLRDLRPSVAMLRCLGSGPWVLARREQVQNKAISILGDKDIASLTKSEINRMFPLEWQRKHLNSLRIHAKLERVSFDSVFRRKSVKHNRELARSLLHNWLGLEKRPKVISMFVRDYLLLDCFPIDRHVRKILKDFDLPTSEEEVLALFSKEGLEARCYARALFQSKSKNPDAIRPNKREK